MIQVQTTGFIGQIFYYLYVNGFYSVILPFFVMFIFTFAAISRVSLFKEKKSLVIVLAMILSLLVVMPYAVEDQSNPVYNVVPTFLKGLQPVSISIIAIIFVMIIYEFLGGQYDESKWLKFIVSITLMFLVVLGIILTIAANYNIHGFALNINFSQMGAFWQMLFSPAVISSIILAVFFIFFVVLVIRGVGGSGAGKVTPKK